MVDQVKVGQTLPYKVTWLNAQGQAVVPAQTSVWDTSDHSKLTAASTGLETGTETGIAAALSVTLQATDPGTGVVATRLMSVLGAITHGTVAPTGQTIAPLGVLGFTVQWFDALNQIVVPTVTSTWDTGDHAVGTAASTGLEAANLTGVGAGSTTITATDPTTGSTASTGFAVSGGGINPNGAQFITPTAGTISSLETGRVVAPVTAWGGNEFGYAYTYALSGAPAGVTIDVDTGGLSVATPVAVGVYPFSITATNRGTPANFNTFTFTLTVLEGVTSGRSGTQILHKTYDPHSGTWGSPSGNNWNSVLLAMQTAIISDQTTAGDGKLRATVVLRKGSLYQYQDNTWMTGIQFLVVQPNTSPASGANPTLQCNISTHIFDVETGPLHLGEASSAFSHPSAPSMKSYCAKIAAASIGDSTVTLLSGGDASKIKAGRWHALMGQNIQVGGFPPNCNYVDYVKVVSVVGTTVTLDRQIRHAYSPTWYEDPNDDDSFGVGRIVPFDTGGTGGAVPSDPRASQRTVLQGVTFLNNPNFGTSPSKLIQVQAIDFQLIDSVITHFSFSMSRNVLFANVTSTIEPAVGEPDKNIETFVVDGGHLGGMGGATGVEYFLLKNSASVGSCQISPRQLRTINCTLGNSADNYTILPWGAAFNGSIMQVSIGAGTTLVHGVGVNIWTPADQTKVPSAPHLIIGTNATWSGNRLIIPKAFVDANQQWLFVYPGYILTTTSPPITTNWGYVNVVTSPGDGTAMWLDVVWVNGSKPLSGALYCGGQFRHLIFGPGVTFSSGTVWSDPGFMSEQTNGVGPTYGFPAGLPAPYNQ